MMAVSVAGNVRGREVDLAVGSTPIDWQRIVR